MESYFSLDLLGAYFQEPKQREGASSSAKSQVQSGEEANFYDLKVVTMDILRFLSGLTTLYGAPSQDTKEKDTVEV